MLIMTTGPLPNACGMPAGRQPMPAGASRCLPDAMKPGIHCVRTHWIRGFMAFQLARCTRTVVLTVPV